MTNECIIQINIGFEKINVKLKRSLYPNSNNTMLLIYKENGEPLGPITINTFVNLPKNMACIDTKSFPNLIDDLTKAEIATTVDMQITPKYDNTYPVCQLNLSKIPNIKPFY